MSAITEHEQVRLMRAVAALCASEMARERNRIAAAIEALRYDAPAARTAQATAARIARQGGAL